MEITPGPGAGGTGKVGVGLTWGVGVVVGAGRVSVGAGITFKTAVAGPLGAAFGREYQTRPTVANSNRNAIKNALKTTQPLKKRDIFLSSPQDIGSKKKARLRIA
jgi:hypothetical protein